MLNKDLQKIFEEFKKEKQLEKLNIKESKRIYKENPDQGNLLLWGTFLPTYYQHQYNVVFVGLQPSKELLKNPHLRDLGNFNVSPSDKKFQQQLIYFGFGGSYVTDIVKLQRDPKSRPSKEDIEFFIPFLKKELEIIKPQIVVSLGVTNRDNEAYGILNNYEKELGINKLMKVYHPAYVHKYNRFKEWNKQFEELKKIIKK